MAQPDGGTIGMGPVGGFFKVLNAGEITFGNAIIGHIIRGLVVYWLIAVLTETSRRPRHVGEAKYCRERRSLTFLEAPDCRELRSLTFLGAQTSWSSRSQ
jgi:hypothetical protein